ncbi:FixH family protein [Pontibacter sp. HSC-36F09]|uniref:FixH family protein n=1 Tax=Pontibacter sp. HSC-36F09 TaxID=2910966 RepID=UPI00209CF585|nr:FixH family protein [Pontibacter sp. HSC-36F09]MCP2045788.1 nitrogen fixation protein FixH [Pontibacter sp. HSC-36F09]
MKTDKNKKFTFWPYAILIGLASFMAYIIYFVVQAMNQDVDLVSKDYYAQEIAYQDQIDRVRRTQALGDVMLQYNEEAGNILLQVPATYQDKNLSGTITLFRPSDDKLDKQLPLQLGRDKSQLIDVGDLEKGLWKVRVNFSDGAEAYYSEKTVQIK